MNIIVRSRSNTPRKHVDSPRRIGPDAQRRRRDRPLVVQRDVDAASFERLMQFFKTDGVGRIVLHFLGVDAACQQNRKKKQAGGKDF